MDFNEGLGRPQATTTAGTLVWKIVSPKSVLENVPKAKPVLMKKENQWRNEVKLRARALQREMYEDGFRTHFTVS